jgi:hypothetical protein
VLLLANRHQNLKLMADARMLWKATGGAGTYAPARGDDDDRPARIRRRHQNSLKLGLTMQMAARADLIILHILIFNYVCMKGAFATNARRFRRHAHQRRTHLRS